MAVPAKSVFWEVANRAWITSPSWLMGVSTSTSETSHFPEEATGKKSGKRTDIYEENNVFNSVPSNNYRDGPVEDTLQILFLPIT